MTKDGKVEKDESAKGGQTAAARDGNGLSREAILETAAEVFRRKGYRATNLQEVADVFGVRRPAIYYYFKSKSEILVEIHNRLLDELGRHLDDVCAMKIPAAEQLALVIAGQVEIYARNISELAVFIENETELPPEVFRRARLEKRRYGERVEEIYATGVAEGSMVDLDPRFVVFALSGVTSWMYRWYHQGGPYQPAQISEIFLRLLQHGYLADSVDGDRSAQTTGAPAGAPRRRA